MASSILSGTPASLAAPLQTAAILPVNGVSTLTLRTDIDSSGGVKVAHFMSGSFNGGGIQPRHYQCFLYDPIENDASGQGSFDELWDGYSIGNNVGIVAMNRGLIFGSRVGTFTGNGVSPVVVPVPSIGAQSQVLCALLAGPTLPASAPVITTIAPTVSFSVVAATGAVYQYEVIG